MNENSDKLRLISNTHDIETKRAFLNEKLLFENFKSSTEPYSDSYSKYKYETKFRKTSKNREILKKCS